MADGGMTEKHEYPSAYGPGTHWATDEAWKILDTIKPGVISIDVRSFLAGQIAGRLMREREDTVEQCAKICEARVKGDDGLPGGNDHGHYASYNCEDLACAAAIRELKPMRRP